MEANMASEPTPLSATGESALAPDQAHGGQARSEFVTAFFHGTRTGLGTGDLITPGFTSNYGKRRVANFVYVTANLSVAIWGAELAVGDGPERVYVVEPVGDLEDDPNVTDKKFPGNPTKSYRTRTPVQVVGEVTNWQGHSPEALARMKENLQRLKEQGVEHIDD